MAPILWPLAPHTLGKHKVLKAYLNAWVPILGITNERILFVDGFAGPGRYTGGEPGSPVIAMETLRDHHARSKLRGEVVFSFIEKDPDRARHLQSEIVPLLAQLGSRAKARVITGAFDETVTGVLDTIDEQKKRLAPAFFMVDPFGVSDTPCQLSSEFSTIPKARSTSPSCGSGLTASKRRTNFRPTLMTYLERRIGVKQ